MNEPSITVPGVEYNGLKQVEETLPAEWYYDPAHHQIELQRIWQREWLYVCREEELSAPNSYKTYELGDQNIVILRTAEGTLSAFHNNCRHRGSILCKGSAGQLKSKLIMPVPPVGLCG